VAQPIETLFPTTIYRAPLLRSGGPAFARELLKEAQKIRDYDSPGRRWSRQNYPGGYTSYGSMDALHRFSSTFDRLRRNVDRHVRRYTQSLYWSLGERTLQMTDCWLNIMPAGCAHSFHVHPQAVISGTYYVRVPRGAPGLRFEDPRMTRLMAAPPRSDDAPREWRTHALMPAQTGSVILFESWLRHEVPANPVSSERVSISFNYHWL
jgi:uncharacterized protein (TIGR02466 family)